MKTSLQNCVQIYKEFLVHQHNVIFFSNSFFIRISTFAESKFYQYMFNKNIKLVLAGIAVALAIWQFSDNYVANGILLLLLAGIFVFLYFKNEIILLAFLKLRKQNLEGTKKLLDKIKNPEAVLVKKQQGYYNYLHGIIMSQQNLTKAEKFFRNAVKLGLSMDQDLAMAKLNLAGIAMQKRRKREAQTLLTEAKKLDKHGVLKEQIGIMKQQMKKI